MTHSARRMRRWESSSSYMVGVLSVTSLDLSHALPADLFRRHAYCIPSGDGIDRIINVSILPPERTPSNQPARPGQSQNLFADSSPALKQVGQAPDKGEAVAGRY